jgi:hypothetical protein
MSVVEGWSSGVVRVNLTRRQVESSPDATTHEPVSRRIERELLRHYGYPIYWGGSGVWGAYGVPAALLGAPPEPVVPPEIPVPATTEVEADQDRHLRSAADLVGYHIKATDGEIGHIDDFLVDDRSWQIQYVQLDTSNWIGGKAVAVATRVLRDIDHGGRTVAVSVSREEVKRSPALETLDVPPSETAPPFVII